MKKQSKVLLTVVVVLGVVLLALSACNLPGSTGEPGLLGSVGGERAVPATPFLEGETIDYGDEDLILREVMAGEGNAIERIVIWLPSKVSQLTLSVNGSAVVGTKNGEDTVIAVAPSAAVVTLEFTDASGAVVKSCEIDLNDILSPAGDCVW